MSFYEPLFYQAQVDMVSISARKAARHLSLWLANHGTMAQPCATVSNRLLASLHISGSTESRCWAGLVQVLSGHVHSYERSQPMLNYSVSPCGIQYITVGQFAWHGWRMGSCVWYESCSRFVCDALWPSCDTGCG